MQANDEAQGPTPGQTGEGPAEGGVWTYRGYEMRPGEFNTAMVHLYRAEVQRSNTWRTRLDTTTNWAIVTASAGISFALSDPGRHHGVILVNILLVYVFLWIEARRYRYYELWSYRTRLLETDFFAAMLVPPFHPSPEWAETLADTLRRPRFPISTWEAVGRRLRRNYVAIIAILFATWLTKNYAQPAPVVSWQEFVARAAIGPFSGAQVLVVMAAMAVATVVLALGTAGLRQATGEVLGESGLLPYIGAKASPQGKTSESDNSGADGGSRTSLSPRGRG